MQQLTAQPTNPSQQIAVQTQQNLQKVTRQKELLEQMLNQKVSLQIIFKLHKPIDIIPIMF